jgi:hypothetical protein
VTQTDRRSSKLVLLVNTQLSLVSCVKRSPCRSTMLSQERVAFIKAIFTLQLSPTLLGELRMALTRRKEKTAVAAGSRSTRSLVGARASQRTSSQLGGKRKANELGSSGGSFESANCRPAPGDGSAPLPASASATGGQAANCSMQLGPLEGGASYAALLAGPVAPLQQSGPLKPTVKGSDQSETAVSPETANRRMSDDMSGPLSGKPDGTRPHAKVANTCLPAGQRPNKKPIFISGFGDVRSFLAWLRASCPGGLTAQLKGENLMVVPSKADVPLSALCGPSTGGGCELSNLHVPGGPLCATSCEEPGQGHA